MRPDASIWIRRLAGRESVLKVIWTGAFPYISAILSRSSRHRVTGLRKPGSPRTAFVHRDGEERVPVLEIEKTI